MAKAKQEKDFQTQANEYANDAIENLRELLGQCTDEDDSPVQEDPLSVEVRSGWYAPGNTDDGAQAPAEYCILLGTGGPASRITGDLDKYNQPESARFEYQDWFKPWTPAQTTSEQDETMLEYAQHFYFGE
jgi:hypothetical protein